jgi:general secretion pathway protein C
MNNAFDPGRLWPLIWIAAAAAVAKLTWVVLVWIVPLPTTGVDHQAHALQRALRYRFRLASEERLKPSQKNKAKTTKPKGSLTAYKLVGIYSTRQRAVVTLMRGSKSIVLTNGSRGGEVEGYRLKEANATTATFVRGDQSVRLALYERKQSGSSSAIRRTRPARTPAPKAPKPSATNREPIQLQGDTHVIKRDLITEYAQNPDRIWKNIGLYEVKNGGKLEGFKVRFVRKGSPFEKLGLKRGDIIKAINGETIVDYATPMRMLRNADTIDDLAITIERNHEEQELKYEVQ